MRIGKLVGAAVVLGVVFAPGVEAAAQDQPEQKLEVTHVTYMWWKKFTPLTNEGLRGTKGSAALIMGSESTNDYVTLPEWEKGRTDNQNSPVAFRRNSSPQIFARFRAVATADAQLKRADIRAVALTEGFPSTKKKTVRFQDNGVSEGDITPESPSLDGLVTFDLEGKVPDQVGVFSVTWRWVAEDILVSTSVGDITVPGPLIIEPEQKVEVYLINEETHKADEILASQFSMRFCFTKAVKFSCQQFDANAKTQKDLVDAYMDRLHNHGYKYIFPNLHKNGYTIPQDKMLLPEANVDSLIENERGNCGTHVFLFLQIVVVQGPHQFSVHGIRLTPELMDDTKNKITIVTQAPDKLAEVANPEGHLITVRLRRLHRSDGQFKKFSETFRTRLIKGINAEEKRWVFGDHCILEYTSNQFYDPSFQKKGPADKQGDEWFRFFRATLLRSEAGAELDTYSIVTAEPPTLDAGLAGAPAWIRGRGFFTPEEVVWKTRKDPGPNFATVASGVNEGLKKGEPVVKKVTGTLEE